MSRILTWERDNEGVLHKVVRDELPEDLGDAMKSADPRDDFFNFTDVVRRFSSVVDRHSTIFQP